MRVINLPALNLTVSLTAYLAAVRQAKANPEMEFKHGLTCWWPCLGKDIVDQFFRGVQDRINQGIPYSKRGKPCTG